jgi:hypothetical protein
MTRIGAPAGGIVPSSLTQGAPISALLAQLPSSLADMASGSFLTGIVLDRAANGLTMLQTANGLLGLKTTVPLPTGSSVTLQIQTAGAQLQAIVLSVTPQGQSAPAAPGQAAVPAPPSATAPLPTPPTAAPAGATPVPPSTITATVIGPSGGPVPTTVSAEQGSAPPTAQAGSTAAPSAPQQGGAAAANAPSLPAANAPTAPPPQAPPATAPQTAAQQAADATPQQTAIPVAAQAYQRQLNAVPPAPLPMTAAPQPAPAASPGGAPPALLAQDPAAAKPLMAEVAPTPLPTGTQVQVRLLPTLQGNTVVVLPQTTEPQAESAALARQAATHAANPVIMATVVARTPAGQVILDSAVGRLLAALPRGEATAPGAKLLLELISGDKAAPAPRPAMAASGLAALARNWPALKDLMRQVQDAPSQQEPAAALDRALPKPGPKLAQQILSYLEAAQNGAKAWLGDTVAKALNTTMGQRVLEQLDRDLREMQQARHGHDGDWRMTLIPLLDGQDLRQLRFFERRRKQQAKQKKEEPGRFVVECEHSEHGAIQLDGLMHEKRLDVIVRSHEALPAEMEHDILVIFGETCTGLDLTGQLFFQTVPAFPVNPLDEIAAAPVRVSV